MKKFTEMNDVEREAFLIFVQYASGDHMSIQGVRNLAKDYCLDFELLKALLDGDGNSVIDFSGKPVESLSLPLFPCLTALLPSLQNSSPSGATIPASPPSTAKS